MGLTEKQSAFEVQGNAIRELKAVAAPKSDIDAAVQPLNALKLEKNDVECQLQSILFADGGLSREAFCQAAVNKLERRLFYIPLFKIYHGVAGLNDYGPPGCTVKSNVLAFWRQHFVLEENMLEVDCPYVTPEVVLKASGHVDKFTDLMVKDEKTGTFYLPITCSRTFAMRSCRILVDFVVARIWNKNMREKRKEMYWKFNRKKIQFGVSKDFYWAIDRTLWAFLMV
ncbi:hypothetical protein HN873_024411 [Arachis hypogaea]|uniref:WHEP-TRS domain-containing protein n=1 Tax=Arachis hypogaea TaxID=3818 RepID=A0A445CI24_ARAHY|nr:hypothetical protein Ahy_A07g037208 [Arachis hypogaea]